MAKHPEDKPRSQPANTAPLVTADPPKPDPDAKPTAPATVIDDGGHQPVIEEPGRIGANITGIAEGRKDDRDRGEHHPGRTSMAEVRESEQRYQKRYPEREYEVVDQPFYDGVQLHEVGARIRWAGPPSKALHPLDGGPRESTTNAPVFPDPMKGRGDARRDDPPAPKGPTIVTQ